MAENAEEVALRTEIRDVILAATDTTKVEAFAIYGEEPADFAPYLKVDGEVNGWYVLPGEMEAMRQTSLHSRFVRFTYEICRLRQVPSGTAEERADAFDSFIGDRANVVNALIDHDYGGGFRIAGDSVPFNKPQWIEAGDANVRYACMAVLGAITLDTRVTC